MEAGLILLAAGITMLLISLALGDVELKCKDFMIRAKKLARDKPPRFVILMLGTLSILAGGGVLVWTAISTTSPDGGPFIKATTTAYTGPSTQGYDVAGTVPVNTRIKVICAVFGQPGTFDGHLVSIWDYTDHGWLNDHFVSTGTPEPTAPGCAGNVGKPHAGSTRTTLASGPYAVMADEGSQLPVRTEPNTAAPVSQELPSGQLVRLQCTLTVGPPIAAPRALGPTHSNNVWDRITAPPGWVPDSFISTYSLTPVAPAC